MKRALYLILACTLVLSVSAGCAAKAQYRELEAPAISVSPACSAQINQSISDFGLTLLQNARAASGSSALVSPLSVAFALSMSANGASGDTLAQCEDVLGGGACLEKLNAACAQWISDYEALGGSTQYSIANSLWVNPEGMLRDEFIGTCRGVFDAQVLECQLSSESIVPSVNEWVSSHTNKMIPSIISKPFEENTAALLINALYLDNTWAAKFDPNATGKREFTHGDGDQERIEFLQNGSMEFPYLQSDAAEGVLLPYDDGRLAFFALMPKLSPDAPDFDQWLSSLSGAELTRQILDAKDTLFLHLALPKFEAEWSGEFKDILANMGLYAAFDPLLADFSRLGDDPNGYYISQVVHAAKIQVNEQGTEAAAATIVAQASGAAAPPEEGITLVFDRPFLYGIVDLETGFPLFLGTFES